MQLSDVKRPYDAVFSLGRNCHPATVMIQNNLRLFSGVLDWKISYSLPDVCNLLRNRFGGFMELANLTFEGYYDQGRKLLLKDNSYNIYSAHDFLTTVNSPDNWPAYTEFKEVLDQRTARFLDYTENAEFLLFIRMGGTLEEAAELQSVLSQLVKHNYHVLLASDNPEPGVKECHWPLEKVCGIQVPLDVTEAELSAYWKEILQGISLVTKPFIL